MSTESRRFRHVARRSGTFVLAAALLVVLVLLLTARAQRWFERTRVFSVRLPDSGYSGLREGSSVEVLGTIAGSVEEVRIDDAGSLWARIAVREDFARFVCTDSTCVIRKKTLDLAGDAYLEIARGAGAPLATGAVLASQVERGLAERFRDAVELGNEVLPAVAEVRAAAREFAELARSLLDPDGSVQRLAANLEALSEGLRDGRGMAGRLLRDENLALDLESTLLRVHETLDHANSAVARLGEGDGSVVAVVSELRELLKEVRPIVTDLGRLTAALPELAATAREEARALPGIVHRSQQTLAEIRRLVEATQRHWLVRSYVEPTAPTGRIGGEGLGGNR